MADWDTLMRALATRMEALGAQAQPRGPWWQGALGKNLLVLQLSESSRVVVAADIGDAARLLLAEMWGRLSATLRGVGLR